MAERGRGIAREIGRALGRGIGRVPFAEAASYQRRVDTDHHELARVLAK